MSTPVVFGAGAFDPAAYSKRIDAIVAAVPPDKRGRIVLKVTPDQLGLAVMARVGGHLQVFGMVTKDARRPISVEGGASVTFIRSLPPDPWTAGELYELLRERGVGRYRAIYRALRAIFGQAFHG